MGGYAYNPTLIDDAPWVSVDRGSADLGLLVRIDPATNSIDRVLAPGPTFGGGGDIVVADGSVWVSDGWQQRRPPTAVVRVPAVGMPSRVERRSPDMNEPQPVRVPDNLRPM